MKTKAKPMHMSLIAWVTFAILTTVVIVSFAQNKDYRLLAFAVPMLAALVIIPMLLTRMSQSAYSDSTPLYEKRAKFHKISNIDLSKVGEVVKIRGAIEKISFKWLNRPHLKINDGTGTISAILFTSLRESLAVGEQVEILGTVMKGFPNQRARVISVVNVKKLSS